MLLELEDVHVHYGKIEALKGISFTVDEGEVVTLIGSNGAGKSTTLRTISGVRPVSAGSVRFGGRDIAGVPAHRIFEIITEINQAGTTILLVEQNAAMALQRAHRAYVLETGRIVRSDEAARLLDDDSVRAAYLGGAVGG